MASTLECSIRKKVSGFVARRVSLRQLQDWLAPILWDIEARRDPDAQELAYSVEFAIAEYSAGHLLECDFRAGLEALRTT